MDRRFGERFAWIEAGDVGDAVSGVKEEMAK